MKKEKSKAAKRFPSSAERKDVFFSFCPLAARRIRAWYARLRRERQGWKAVCCFFLEPRFSSRASSLAAVSLSLSLLFDGMTFFSFFLSLLLTSVLMRVSLGGSFSCAFHASPPGAAAASVEAIFFGKFSRERTEGFFSFLSARKVGLAGELLFFCFLCGVQGGGERRS